MIAVVDYGMGNLHSVVKALERAAGGEEVRLTSDASDVDAAARAVLPGVGAFGDTMAGLSSRGLIPPLKRLFDDGRPFLGICMGMQALYAASEESPGVEGLGVIPATLRLLPSDKVKVPHMGWNALTFTQPNALFAGLESGAHVYFCHSYCADLSDPSTTVATSEHGMCFAAAVARGPICGTQFHPEKSQAVGLKILENFTHVPAAART
jgi:glutamine amidotransferase